MTPSDIPYSSYANRQPSTQVRKAWRDLFSFNKTKSLKTLLKHSPQGFSLPHTRSPACLSFQTLLRPPKLSHGLSHHFPDVQILKEDPSQLPICIKLKFFKASGLPPAPSDFDLSSVCARIVLIKNDDPTLPLSNVHVVFRSEGRQNWELVV
ncbi:hypothetical protein GEMRC1_008164 [Eukaryota sp. GEM-RC1]